MSVLAFNLGGPEILLVVLVVLLLFGSSQLPKLARSLGQASKELRKGIDDAGQPDSADDDSATETEGKNKIRG